MNYCYLDTPIGKLLLAGDEQGVHRITFPAKGQTGSCGPGRTGLDRIHARPARRGCASVERIFRGTSNRVRSPARAGRHAFSEVGMAPSARYSLRRNHFLRRAGSPIRKSKSLPSSWGSQWPEPSPHRDSVPSGDWSKRKNDRLRRRYTGQRSFARAGVKAEKLVGRLSRSLPPQP